LRRLIPSRRAAITGAALAVILIYASVLRLDALFGKFGPFTHPGWLVTLEHSVGAVHGAVVPPSWTWTRKDPPYAGGDPYSYLKYAREMRSFYQAHVREPVFLATTRMFLALTGDQDVGVSFASLSFSVLCVFATFLLGSALGGRWVGLLAALALAVEYEMVTWAPDGWRDDAFTFMATMTVWAMLRLDARVDFRRAVALGLVAGFACLTRITAAFFILPGLVWLVATAGRAEWRARLKPVGLAALLTAIVVAPYLISCALATGDPFFALDAHTVYYRAAEGVPYDTKQSAAGYVAEKFRTRPVLSTDTALRGVVIYPFEIKWRGLDSWMRGLGSVLKWLAVCGLIAWVWDRRGRFLLGTLACLLVPYMMTWRVGDGGAWRFTMPAYPIYLVAALGFGATAIATILSLARGGWRTIDGRAGQRIALRTGIIAAGTTAVLLALHWSPYFVARESLQVGDSTSIAAGPDDQVFFTKGWTDLVKAGQVVARLAESNRAEIAVPLPARREYRLVIRMDPLPFPNAPPQRVRVTLDGRDLGTMQLTWDPQRVGAYTLTIPAEVGTGRHRLEFSADYLSEMAGVGDMYPEIDRSKQVGFRLWYVRLTPM
jgi:hypothetical protein